MNLAETYTPSIDLAYAYAIHAAAMANIPCPKRAIRYAERARALSRTLGELRIEGVALGFLASALYNAGRLGECIRAAEESLRIGARAGDARVEFGGYYYSAASHHGLGSLKVAAEAARRGYLTLCDKQIVTPILEVWVAATGGDVPAVHLEKQLDRTVEDPLIYRTVLVSKGIRHLYLGHLEEAIASIEKASTKLVAQLSASQPGWLATALRRRIEELVPYHLLEVKELIARCRKATRRARRAGRRFRFVLPHALRESAYVAAFCGKSRPARRYVNKSLSVAKRLEMRFEYAQSLYARGRLGQGFGWTRAAEDLHEAEAALNDLDGAFAIGPAHTPAITLSFADRFLTVLDAGRGIAHALSRDAVCAAVRQAALTLLRAEACRVVDIPGGDAPGDFVPADPHVSGTAVRRALALGRPVVFGDGTAEGKSEGMSVAGVRSALAAPIFVHGRPAACFYATHHKVAGLFSAEEERLASFIASLAGAALENADGFAQVHALSDERARLYEQAREAVRARDEFLLVASHELNTPLTSLLLYVQSIVREATRRVPGGQDALRLEGVDRQIRRLGVLIRNLVELSRITSGRLDFRIEEVDLADLVREVVERVSGDLRQAECTLALSAEASVIGHWDRLRLEQLVTNLLSNAIKFGAGKPIEVSVAKDGSSGRLVVRDHGIGIAPEDQARIFDRFERAVSSRHYGGFGVGLWIVRQIAQGLGGQIKVASEPERGSTFTVELPC